MVVGSWLAELSGADVWWIVEFAGTRLLVESQKRRRRIGDTSVLSMTMEQVVAQQQQEIFTLKAQVADQPGLADAVRAINNLATAQARIDTASLIDVKGLCRPKEFSGKEEDFQQWSKKTKHFSLNCDHEVTSGFRV